MLTELWRRIDEYSKNFNKETENVKKRTTEWNNTINEKCTRENQQQI